MLRNVEVDYQGDGQGYAATLQPFPVTGWGLDPESAINALESAILVYFQRLSDDHKLLEYLAEEILVGWV